MARGVACHLPDTFFALHAKTGGSTVYSYLKDELLGPDAHFAAQGQPSFPCLRHLSPAEIRSLAGEGFALPSISTMMAAFYYNPWAPWWGPKEEPLLL